jgi:hypothetical protein
MLFLNIYLASHCPPPPRYGIWYKYLKLKYSIQNFNLKSAFNTSGTIFQVKLTIFDSCRAIICPTVKMKVFKLYMYLIPLHVPSILRYG